MSKQTDFPNLRAGEWEKRSEPTPKYNCIAFAAGLSDVYWWPDPFPDPLNDYWPAGIACEETVEAIAELYQSLGYKPCDHANFESGYEKVAIYANDTEPTHAAHQLPNGHWISKLGVEEDIEHNLLDSLSGPCYGKPVRFLKRRVPE